MVVVLQWLLYTSVSVKVPHLHAHTKEIQNLKWHWIHKGTDTLSNKFLFLLIQVTRPKTAWAQVSFLSVSQHHYCFITVTGHLLLTGKWQIHNGDGGGFVCVSGHYVQ